MTIARREFIGFGALGLGAIAIDGCGGLLKAPVAPAADEVDRVLRDLDRVVAQLEVLEPDVTRFGIQKNVPRADEGRKAVTQMLTTMCFLGSYRDVPESLWTEPRIEERLGKTLPRINAAINRARDHLAQMTPEDAARVDEKLARDPNFTMRVMERVDEYAKQVDVPLEQRTYLRTATAQLAGRFRYEGTKEVTSKIAGQYKRVLAQRANALGMQTEVEASGGGGGDEQPKTEPAPLRVQFKTRAQPKDVRAATCGLEPQISVGGSQQPVQLDWEEFRCPTSAPVTVGQSAVRGAVHMEAGENGQNVVTLVLYPPAGSTEDLTGSVTAIAQELRRRLALGQACTTSDECAPLRCIDEVCRDPFNARPNMTHASSTSPQAQSRLGAAGESCRTKADCEGDLVCAQNTCRSEENLPSSAKLMATTRKVAKWGAILLIPPICAIGILVLLVCLFMVIVAGCMYAGGD